MEILKISALRGPNIWSRKPTLEAWVDLQDLKDTSSDSIPGYVDRLMAYLPGLIEHRCSVGERGGFLKRLRDGTYPAHTLEHVTIELQTLAGTVVGFGKARETSREGVYKVVVRFKDEQVARACLLTARELILAAMRDRPFDLAGEVKRLKELADSVMLGPSTAAIVNAAEARGIPARRLSEGSLVQLGQGVKQRRIWTAETDRTSAIAESIASDKELTKSLLRAGGVPVPEGRAVESAADAWAAAQEFGGAVVVKPVDGNHGRGVSIQLTERADIESAYQLALEEGSGVLVERFIPGNEHRLLVVGNKLVAAARGETAYVTGDGEHSVEKLVELQLNSDPRRGEGDECPLNPVEIDAVACLELQRQGLNPKAVPAKGARILIQRNGNVAFDVTELVHPTVAAHAVLAARIVGLDIAGLDLVVEDISKPLEPQRGAVVEVNAGPGLHPHLKPASGKPQPVGEAIAATLFPEGEDGRIPIVCVTGTNGKTTVSRLTAHMLRTAGWVTGLACSDGVDVDGRPVDGGDCAGPRSARKVLMNPTVEAAVLEAGRGGILREGLGFDRCQVAVVTNIGEADHLGEYFIDTPEQMYTVKRSPVDVVLATGAAVLKADEPLVAEMAPLSAGSVVFFALDANHPVVAAHRAQGKRAVVVKDGAVVLAEGDSEQVLAPLSAIPLARAGAVGFQVENVLAAVGAAWSLKISPEAMRSALAAFRGDAGDLPGRFNLFEAGGAKVLVDDCHNASALRSLSAALDKLGYSQRAAVYSAGANRRDQDIVRQGEVLAQAFDQVFIYEDPSASDRQPGQITTLLRQGLAKGGRVQKIQEIRGHRQAIEAALNQVKRDELVVVQTEDNGVEPTLAIVRAWAAQRQAARSGT